MIYQDVHVYLHNLIVNEQIRVGPIEETPTQERYYKKIVSANYNYISVLVLFAHPSITTLKIPIF
jgi:hypothetical protein